MADSNQVLVKDIDHTITLNAPIDKVWEMVSSGEKISLWFMENDLKPEVGSKFTIHSIFGSAPCEVEEVQPPNKLSFTWDNFGWHVTFEAKEDGGKTKFNIIHSGWGNADDIVPVVKEKSSEIRDRMEFGWANVLNALKEALGGRQTV